MSQTDTMTAREEEVLRKAREALASELENRGEEFDAEYPVPVAPVIKEIDALLSLKETAL